MPAGAPVELLSPRSAVLQAGAPVRMTQNAGCCVPKGLPEWTSSVPAVARVLGGWVNPMSRGSPLAMGYAPQVRRLRASELVEPALYQNVDRTVGTRTPVSGSPLMACGIMTSRPVPLQPKHVTRGALPLPAPVAPEPRQ